MAGLAAQVAVTSGVCALQCEQGIWGLASSTDLTGCITGSGKTSTTKDLFGHGGVGSCFPLTFICSFSYFQNHLFH